MLKYTTVTMNLLETIVLCVCPSVTMDLWKLIIFKKLSGCMFMYYSQQQWICWKTNKLNYNSLKNISPSTNFKL